MEISFKESHSLPAGNQNTKIRLKKSEIKAFACRLKARWNSSNWTEREISLKKGKSTDIHKGKFGEDFQILDQIPFPALEQSENSGLRILFGDC